MKVFEGEKSGIEVNRGDERDRGISFKNETVTLTLIREFLGPSPSVFSEKNPESSLVTVGTSKMKIICTNTVSVGLSYCTYFKWHMPI